MYCTAWATMQYSVRNHNGKEYEKEHIYTHMYILYIYLNHFAIQQKLKQRCNSTVLKKKPENLGCWPQQPKLVHHGKFWREISRVACARCCWFSTKCWACKCFSGRAAMKFMRFLKPLERLKSKGIEGKSRTMDYVSKLSAQWFYPLRFYMTILQNMIFQMGKMYLA